MSHHADGDEARHWAERAALLTPIAKSFATDAGVDVASLGIQTHGGMGFIEETGAARFWRESRGDGIYDIPGQLIRAAGDSRARHIGDQVEISAGWRASKILSFAVSLSAFRAGAFIKDTGPARTIRMAGAEAG